MLELTPAEMAALAAWSASYNPVMTPVPRDTVSDQIAARIDSVQGDIPTKHRQASKMTADLIEEILAATIGKDRETAKNTLETIFKSKEVSVSIVKTWDTEDTYATIKTGQ